MYCISYWNSPVLGDMLVFRCIIPSIFSQGEKKTLSNFQPTVTFSGVNGGKPRKTQQVSTTVSHLGTYEASCPKGGDLGRRPDGGKPGGWFGWLEWYVWGMFFLEKTRPKGNGFNDKLLIVMICINIIIYIIVCVCYDFVRKLSLLCITTVLI